MTGQIPKYGENFRRERLPYTGEGHDFSMAFTVYVLKRDPRWRIRATRDSEHWYIQRRVGEPRTDDVAKWISITDPDDTFGEAMIRMLDGIDYGYYAVKEY